MSVNDNVYNESGWKRGGRHGDRNLACSLLCQSDGLSGYLVLGERQANLLRMVVVSPDQPDFHVRSENICAVSGFRLSRRD